MSDCRLKFKECVDCKEWNGNRTHCANICSKPYAAWDGFNKYMELEEQGLLVRLPCKVGDTIFRINKYAKEPIISMKVLQIRFGELYIGNSFLRIDAINDEDMGEFCYFKDDIGKTVFLTKSEAEATLAEMEE